MTESTAEESVDLIAGIEAAFASARRGLVTLHEAEVIDAYGTEEQRRNARERDPEHDWRDIQGVAVSECPNALPHLDPVSWRFYLPVFICMGLRRLGAPGNDAIDRAIYALALSDDPLLAKYQLERFATLEPAQRLAVRRFLELAANHEAHCDGHVAQLALERYWAA